MNEDSDTAFRSEALIKEMEISGGGQIWEFPKIRGTLFWVLIIRILLFRVLYWGPLFSETPISGPGMLVLRAHAGLLAKQNYVHEQDKQESSSHVYYYSLPLTPELCRSPPPFDDHNPTLVGKVLVIRVHLYCKTSLSPPQRCCIYRDRGRGSTQKQLTLMRR